MTKHHVDENLDGFHVPHLGPPLGIQVIITFVLCGCLILFINWVVVILSVIWIILSLYWMWEQHKYFKWVSRPLPEKTLDDEGWVE